MALRDLNDARAFDVASIALEPDALRKIPAALALAHDILPLSSEGNVLTVAVPYPVDEDVIEQVRFATGMHVKTINAPRAAIHNLLTNAYPPPERIVRGGIEGVAAAPAVTAAEEIHRAAIDLQASDIHVEPTRRGGRIRYRVDGLLHEGKLLDSPLYNQIVSRIKLLAGMDIADRRQPQDGRYNIEAAGHSFDTRVSSIPSILGEKLVLRLLDRGAGVPHLRDLEMPPYIGESFVRACNAPHGFIVAAGPTGSGKTTTLYGAMAQRNTVSENLCTIEDPIEVHIPGVSQVQVNGRAGVTFASALRAFLRQDPDVIMVGEMRDTETSLAATTAALSGQLLLTTLHSTDAHGALERLGELGIRRTTMAVALTAVVAQRLVRRLCDRCKEQTVAGAQPAREYGIPEDTVVFQPAGCAVCQGCGYRGRCGIFEALFFDDAMREAVASGLSGVALKRRAQRQGFRPMFLHGLQRVIAGQTSFQELRRVMAFERVS